MKLRSFLLLPVLTLSLVACGADSQAESSGEPDISEQATTSSTATSTGEENSSPSAHTSDVPTSAASPTSSLSSPNQVQNDRVELTRFYPVSEQIAADGKVGILTTPTANIGCDIWAADGIAACGVKSYFDEGKYPNDSGIGSSWVFALGDDVSEVEIAPRGDAMFFMMGQQEGHPPQVLEYGTSVQYGTVECTSEIEALTCSNTATGRGVTMSAEGYTTF